MNEPNPSSPQTTASAAPGSADRAPLHVRLGIAAVAVAFIGFVAIIYVRSWLNRAPVPNAVLLVRGSPEVEGATVRIEGQPRTETISANGDYCCRFHVAPGEYRVWLEFRGAVEQADVKVKSSQVVSISYGRMARNGSAQTRRAAPARLGDREASK